MAIETVTVLFTDLVGSTELMSRVGEVAADELRREHFALLRAAIADAGGHEVKNLGDGLMVGFGGAGAALACAVAMQQAIMARSASLEPLEPLAIRIGVASGEVESEDDDYFGVPVVEAARLCAAAGTGEIFITMMVRLLVQSRGGFDFDALGGLELKGLGEPVDAHRVRWEPLPVGDADDGGAVAVPVQKALVSLGSGAAVGRVAQRAVLTGAWQAAEAGERRVVLVSGEPGIGKTTLTSSLALEVAAGGATVLYGRCDEDLHVPYQPWVEALGHLITHVSDDLVEAHVAACGVVLGRLVPQLLQRSAAQVAGTAAAGDDDTERHLLFAAVTDLLDRAAREAVVLVLLDDLHWADSATVQLLRHVVMEGRAHHLVVLGTFRDSDIGVDHPLTGTLARLHRVDGVDRVSLLGLGDDELLVLLETLAGHDMDDDGIALRNALLAETDGNPFFITEMLWHLRETDAIRLGADGRWEPSSDLAVAGLPVSIREVVGQRVRALGAETHQVLTMASVIGREFELGLLERVVDIDGDRLVDVCDAAVAAAVLRESDRPGGYMFVHALIERSLYDELSTNKRARAHQSVAAALEELLGDHPGDRIGELAHHWAQATRPADNDRAVTYARLAGDHALGALAPHEAVHWYRQALDLSRGTGGDDAGEARILLGLGDAQRQSGIAEFRDTLLHAAHLAHRIDDVDVLIRAAIGNTRGFESATGDVDDERIEVIQLALDRLGGADDSADRARLLAQKAMELLYGAGLDERFALAEKAVATARRSGDSTALLDVLHRSCRAVEVPWTLQQRIAWANEGCAIADTLGDPARRFFMHEHGLESSLLAADLGAMAEHAAVLEEVVERLPDATCQWMAAFHRPTMAVLQGDLAEADRLAETALTVGLDSGQTDAILIFGAQLENIRGHQGRLDEMILSTEQAIVRSPQMHTYRAALARSCQYAGDHDRARELLRREHDNDFVTGHESAWMLTHAYWADVASRLHEHDAARIIRDRIADFPSQIVTARITVTPALAHYTGLLEHSLGNHDQAAAAFTHALEIAERMRSPLLIATTQAAFAALLAERATDDDLQRARTMADAASAAATAGGYGYVRADAERVLATFA